VGILLCLIEEEAHYVAMFGMQLKRRCFVDEFSGPNVGGEKGRANLETRKLCVGTEPPSFLRNGTSVTAISRPRNLKRQRNKKGGRRKERDTFPVERKGKHEKKQKQNADESHK